MRLSDLKSGELGVVVSVDSVIEERLRSLGIGVGTSVRQLRVAPYSKAVVIETCGSMFFLRSEAAELIEVKRV